MTVSYLITLYNKEEFIGAVLDAVLAEQRETGGEIIIYDDVSTDRSPQIVEERIAAHPAQAGIVHVVRGDRNRGVGYATNYLIKIAAQPYVRLVDADDVLIKGSTAQMLRHLKANNLGFIYGGTTEVGNEPPGLDRQTYAECFRLKNPVRAILRHTVAGASPSLFVADVLKKAVPVPDWIRRTQDFLVTLRVANFGTPIGYIKDIVSIGPSNRTGNNMSAALSAMFAEISRDVAQDGNDLPLADLRYASRRYAGRAAKYFRRRAPHKLSTHEKFDLWRWHNLGWLASRSACIARLISVADFLDRDRDVLVTGPSRQENARRRLPRRWPMLRLADALVARVPAPKNKHGVLILRMFGIGDALLFRATLEQYAEALDVPLSEVTVLGSIAWQAADLFFGDVKTEFINERRFARNFPYRVRTMLRLRHRGFKTAICGMRFRQPHVIESLMLASGANERIVVEPRADEKYEAMFAHYLPRMTRVIPMPEPERPRAGDGQPLPLMHEIDQQLVFLSAVAGRSITLAALPKLAVRHGAVPLVHAGERYAVLNMGASYARRRWPLAHYFEIAQRLREQGITALFLGGPAEENLRQDIKALAARSSGADKARMIVSINELDLADVAHLLNEAELIVSNDSGIGHLSIMLGRPSVLILGGGHFGSFMPYPPALAPARTRFLFQRMPCYHCNWNCSMIPQGGQTFPCVERVTVEQTWQALQDVA
jgi:glycosyltransferase involved in cell wall biosynthesis